ncbi:MAG TPA: hypothetical protein DCS93_31460 [Microscillaceae bacterium]|nr:hypothetical protein [Microscillaceae bacterium]
MLSNALLENFPPNNEKDVFDIIQFIKKSPLAKDYWRILKSLYKKTETYFLNLTEEEIYSVDKNQLLMLTHLIFRLDQADVKHNTSPFPTQATLRYMKRRARRCLRILAKTHPQFYFEIVAKLLTFQSGKTSLNKNNQWVMMDVLFGNSRRAHQKSHGQGSYHFDPNAYHLHQQEEGQPQIWDTQLKFVQELLMKDLPWEIYEFAIKTLNRHQATPTQLSEEVLEKFLNAPSNWLKRTATQLIYQTFLFQGVKPALFAGMWFYSNATVRKKIEEVDANRPKRDADWYKEYGKQLYKFSFNELRNGNNSRRVVQALEQVQQKYSKEIQPDSILPIAPALFQSKHNALQELALSGADFAQPNEAIQWLEALGGDVAPNLYQRLAKKLMSKFKKKNIYTNEIEPYIYNVSKYVSDFGWRLSDKVSIWSMYNIWYNLGGYQDYRRAKREYFINAITSEAGAKAFIKYFTQNRYTLNYIKSYALDDVMEVGLPKIQEFILADLVRNFKDNPLNQLQRLSGLSESLRNKIVAEAIEVVKNRKLFDTYWETSTGLWAADENTWSKEIFMQLLALANLTNRAIDNLVDHMFERSDSLVNAILNFFSDLPEKARRRNYFIQKLGARLSGNVQTAAQIPPELLAEVMKSMDFDTLLRLTATADEEAWKNLSKSVYQQLLDKQNEVGFWKNILERVLESENEVLSSRLIDDQEFFKLFQEQTDATVIEITHPVFEQVLLGWVQNHESVFSMGSAHLATLCFHKLPTLRQWGLAKAKSLGINLNFGLQMLESGIPDTMQTSREYFNTLPASSEEESEAALALCDSPSKEVRAFGMEFLAQRKEKFKDHPQVLAFLSEHADAYVQAFVSQEISLQQLNQPFVERFDKEVLRMKNRSRKAKEHTKKRVEVSLQMDAEVLKEVARSGGRTDAEWAVLQLTKKALAGEEIEGFSLD